MFFSRVQLTSAIASQSQLGLLLRDRSYGMHRLLWDLFDKKNHFLYREESAREQKGIGRNLPIYYVLSETCPDQNSLIFEVNSKPYSPQLNAGESLEFRLRANPTVSRKVNGQERSKRHDVVMDAQYQWLSTACEERSLDTLGRKSELLQRLSSHSDFNSEGGQQQLKQNLNGAVENATFRWLGDRGIKSGFELHPIKLQTTAYRWHALPEKGRKAGFSSLDYQGLLTVVDPDKLLKRIYQGFGPSKAFGCGLMLIRRIV